MNGRTRTHGTSERGFTLLEAMVALAITAVVMASAMPRFAELSQMFARANARSYLLVDLKRAQAETITQGCRGILKINAAGTKYDFGCDYLSYDTSATPNPDSIFFSRNLPSGLTVTASGPVIFNSRGQSVDATGIISNVQLKLIDRRTGMVGQFASGTLLGTGVFVYE